MSCRTTLATRQQIAEALAELGEDLHRHVQRVTADMGITPVQAAVLKFAEQPVRMGVLAERIHCQPSHITSVVDALEERGWVVRDHDPTDRRALTVQRTDPGRDVLDEILERLADSGPSLLSNLDETEQSFLLRLLQKAIGREAEPL